MKNTIKYIARFIVETASPIAVGAGEKGLLVDRLIGRDANKLPYIPGTSLAGVIRHTIAKNSNYSENEIQRLFGFQEQKNGQGSRITFSPAKLIAKDGKTVLEGLSNVDFSQGYYSFFQKLPERDHVRITHKGGADTKGYGKFDEELVFKGTRFVFEISLTGTPEDADIWNNILQIFHEPFFRIGAGTRKGFGQLKIIECREKTFDLTVEQNLFDFLDKSSSLNYDCSDWNIFTKKEANKERWYHYQIQLIPENFFLFGAGFGDKEVDMKPKKERFFDWSSGEPKLGEAQEYLLVPATSIKGAIAHRTAFHYNRLEEKTLSKPFEDKQHFLPAFNAKKAMSEFNLGVDIEQLDLSARSEEWEQLATKIENLTVDFFYNNAVEWSDFIHKSEVIEKQYEQTSLPVEENNNAVKMLFGFANSAEEGTRGKVLMSDVYLEKDTATEKIFNHVAIDRFTGGGIDGALYQEKVVHTNNFQLDIYIEKDAFKEKNIQAAFEDTLKDLTTGKLQLGGNTTKGHGAFKGSFKLKTE